MVTAVEEVQTEAMKNNTIAVGDLIADHFLITSKMYSGTASDVFVASDTADGKEYVVKVSTKSKKNETSEALIYKLLDTAPRGIPRVIFQGEVPHFPDCSLLVMEKFGKSVKEYWDMCGNRFCVVTAAMIAIQVLERLSFVHERGVFHGDITLENLVMGATKEEETVVYLIDFSNSKTFLNECGEETKLKKTSSDEIVYNEDRTYNEPWKSSPLEEDIIKEQIANEGIACSEAMAGHEQAPTSRASEETITAGSTTDHTPGEASRPDGKSIPVASALEEIAYRSAARNDQSHETNLTDDEAIAEETVSEDIEAIRDQQPGEIYNFKQEMDTESSMSEELCQSGDIEGNQPSEISRRSDLMTLCFTLVRLVKGSLPWEENDSMENLRDSERNSVCWMIFQGLPQEFRLFFSYVESLRFEEKPDYKALVLLFKDFLHETVSKAELKAFAFEWMNHSKYVSPSL